MKQQRHELVKCHRGGRLGGCVLRFVTRELCSTICPVKIGELELESAVDVFDNRFTFALSWLGDKHVYAHHFG